MNSLFDPIMLGQIECASRIAMAPCTRCMSPNFTPTDDVAAYYRRRAEDGVGLLISEGTVISERGCGYLGAPGIFGDEQVRAWSRATDAVHDAGGRMICQIWHVGAVAHPRTTGGVLPESPSGISPEGNVSRIVDERGNPVPFGPSESMSKARIAEVIDEYRRAAANSLEAGFDGVEIHGAHGYLIDQFTNANFNRRRDAWGGENRVRFAHEVTRAVVSEVGAGRVVFRFSPKMSVTSRPWSAAESTFDLLLESLWDAGLRVLHASNLDYDEKILRSDASVEEPDLTLHAACRRKWQAQVIGVGSLSPERATSALANDEVDMVAFGRALIANADFCQRVRSKTPLVDYDPAMLATLH
jgi:N-ethylmaleimide reductase